MNELKRSFGVHVWFDGWAWALTLERDMRCDSNVGIRSNLRESGYSRSVSNSGVATFDPFPVNPVYKASLSAWNFVMVKNTLFWLFICCDGMDNSVAVNVVQDQFTVYLLACAHTERCSDDWDFWWWLRIINLQTLVYTVQRLIWAFNEIYISGQHVSVQPGKKDTTWTNNRAKLGKLFEES